MTWETVIGLEIHVHLKTQTKMFCRCPVGFGAGENSQTCPICLGFPGALPVMNRRAVEWTIKLGLALGCEIASEAVFARKHYPYPDLPKGYQISQYDLPSCINGNVILPTADGDRSIGIVRAHLEEDAAKTVHVGGRSGRIGGADYSLVDFNRGGTPLVEIVTAPDIRSADEARRFLQLLRQTVVELGISDAEMEKGQLRADANVSVRPAGSDELRTRTEIKNMNSFNFIARGIEAEVERQIGVWESGDEVRQQTYDFDAATGTLSARRTKEEADDYRYFPEPDLVPVEPAGRSRRVPSRGAPRVARCTDPPHRAFDRPRPRDGSRHGQNDRLWDETSRRAPTQWRRRTSSRMTSSARASIRCRCPRRVAKLATARDRIPRAAFTRRCPKLGEPGFCPSRTSRRRRSRTPTSSGRSSTGSSRRTPARSPRTEAAKRGSSGSSWGRS